GPIGGGGWPRPEILGASELLGEELRTNQFSIARDETAVCLTGEGQLRDRRHRERIKHAAYDDPNDFLQDRLNDELDHGISFQSARVRGPGAVQPVASR